VLVLSQFAGAAQELKSALIVNPYDIEATAAAIARAFTMPLEERKDRWQANMAVLRASSVHDWASHFLQALANEAEGGSSAGRWTKPAFQDPPAWTGLVRPEPRCAAPVRTAPQHWYGDPGPRAILYAKETGRTLRNCACATGLSAPS